MIQLEMCKRTDKRYQEIRNRHYVDNKGSHGQQVHFLIYYNGTIVGIISGASSVYSVKTRDEFFHIPRDKTSKETLYLPAIINNTVFRLEYHEKNLATRVLSKWRKVVSTLWEELYGVPVIGFETFVVEEDWRKGTLYKADNWVYVGDTVGSTKHHAGGLKNKHTRVDVIKKMIYCKWHNKSKPTTVYISSWRGKTLEEKIRNKDLAYKRDKLIGTMF